MRHCFVQRHDFLFYHRVLLGSYEDGCLRKNSYDEQFSWRHEFPPTHFLVDGLLSLGSDPKKVLATFNPGATRANYDKHRQVTLRIYECPHVNSFCLLQLDHLRLNS